MKQENLRILKVYTQNGKQVAFAVTNGRVIHQVDKETIEESIKNGNSYVNASVSSSGIFRVDSNVQREPFKKTKLEIIGFLYVSASKHSVTDKQHAFCYDVSNLFFEALFMLMCKTAAFRQFI